ncbi:MAG: sulfatase-like hydrolase/transferase [Deltaproteobacteria bacterium]|nr:sulfatase-like hydrolase/transferase [Deltaproteobacteria bacterium]
MNRTRTQILDFLHLFTLSAFAVAQPIFDLLGRQAEFFVARRSEPIDIMILAAVLSLAVPLVPVVIEIAVGLVNSKARKACHLFFVGVLVALIILPALKRANFFAIGPLLTAAAVAGLVFAFAYVRFRAARMFVSVLAPAVIIFPALFLFHSPVNRLLFRVEPVLHSTGLGSTPPIVMLVLDEMSSVSLMDERQHIDPVRFPNFAALAENATWFRNATTVVEVTETALPALLTGRYPTERRLPVASEFPNNLFTLLGESYRLEVVEPVTELCPRSLLDGGSDREPLKARISSLFVDARLVYLHLILPHELTRMLPPINHNWSGFFVDRAKEELKRDRRRQFLEFVDRIGRSEKPTLYFNHSMLPHCPYEYLPSGRKYSLTNGVMGLLPNTETWRRDEWPVIRAHQRYLLQLEFVDRLLGRLIQRLKEQGLYDRAAILVTSDHGVSFIPGESRRLASPANLSDILNVLLMIKAPGQRQGVIDDSNMETVDVLPALAHLLGMKIPWTVDGASPFDPSRKERAEKTLYRQDLRKLTFAPEQAAKLESLQRQLARFGSGRERGLFPEAPSSHNLIGRRPAEFQLEPNTEMYVHFDRKTFYAELNPALETHDGNRATFSAVVSDSCFFPGRNRIEAYLVHGASEVVKLARIESNADLLFSFKKEGESEYLIDIHGKSMPILPGSLKGWVDAAVPESDYVRLEGWSADLASGEPAREIALLAGDQCIYADTTNRERSDVASHFNNPRLVGCGFVFRLPRRLFERRPIRVLAVSRAGQASELSYQPHTEWLRNAGESSFDARTVFSGFVKSGLDEVSCTLESVEDRERIVCSDGASIPIEEGAVEGWLETARSDNGAVHLIGWAAEVSEARLPAAVVVFAGRDFIQGTLAFHDRPDVSGHFSDPRLMRCGYTMDVLPGDIRGRSLRVLAVSTSGKASEVTYHPGTEWVRSGER